MAKDFLLKHRCPHFVLGEWLALESDRQTIRPVQQISSSQVGLKFNGILVPPEGLKSPVKVTSRIPEPYTLNKGSLDFVRVQVGGSSFQRVNLPQGSLVNTDELVRVLNTQLQGVKVSNYRGRLVFEIEDKGLPASLYFNGGAAHEILGLPTQRFYRGKEVLPPWSLMQDDPLNPDRRSIIFSEPLQNVGGVWEMSYFTRQQNCRRCSGLGIENDIRHDVSTGEPKFVTGIDLLAQEVDKIVFTIKGSNIFYSWYGTSIIDLIGEKILRGGAVLEAQLISEISNTLERFRSVKNQQATLQPVGDQEYFSRVRSIQVQQDEFDPTTFQIQIEIQNRAGEVDVLQQTLLLNDPTTGRRIVG